MSLGLWCHANVSYQEAAQLNSGVAGRKKNNQRILNAALAFVTTRMVRYKQYVSMLIFLTLLFDDFLESTAQHPQNPRSPCCQSTQRGWRAPLIGWFI